MITEVELEISSDCNAACPGCPRTQHIELVKPTNLTLEQIQTWFPNPKDIQFKFCGVLGDPIVNPQCMEITKYLVDNDAYVAYSTNGGRNNVDWWSELGATSKRLGGDKLKVHFCVDGTESNYIYRVNTSYKVIKRNMQAYSDAGGKANWIFIVFDHNEHEIEEAKQLANQLGFRFATRTGMRNSLNDWVAKIKKKDNTKNKIVTEQKLITTTGSKSHSKVAVVKKLDEFIQDKNKSQEQTKQIVDSIDCKFYHGNEIFIGADSTLWPCCFLYDSDFHNRHGIKEKYSVYPKDWNNLNMHTIDQILSTDYYKHALRDSWDPQHNLHISRCIRTCAKNRAYQNEIKYS
mgnify:CR=1 FL=1|tara:strand:+ start:1387 stop:2427 length:1041 start_codon:yes stop_codon:yes gene_type:complete